MHRYQSPNPLYPPMIEGNSGGGQNPNPGQPIGGTQNSLPQNPLVNPFQPAPNTPNTILPAESPYIYPPNIHIPPKEDIYRSRIYFTSPYPQNREWGEFMEQKLKEDCRGQRLQILKILEVANIEATFIHFLQHKFGSSFQERCVHFLYKSTSLDYLKRGDEGPHIYFQDIHKIGGIRLSADPLRCLQRSDPLRTAIIRVMVYIPPNLPGTEPNFRQQKTDLILLRSDTLIPTHLFHVKYGGLKAGCPQYNSLKKEYKDAGRGSGLHLEPTSIFTCQDEKWFKQQMKRAKGEKYSSNLFRVGYLSTSEAKIKRFHENLNSKPILKKGKSGSYELSLCPGSGEALDAKRIFTLRCLVYNSYLPKSKAEESKGEERLLVKHWENICPTHSISAQISGGFSLPKGHKDLKNLEKEFEDAQKGHLDQIKIKGVMLIPGAEKVGESLAAQHGANYNETYYTIYYIASSLQKISKYYERHKRSELMSYSQKGTLGNGFYFSQDPIDCSRFYSKDKLILRVKIYQHPGFSCKKEEKKICVERLNPNDGIIVTHSLRYTGQKDIYTVKLHQTSGEYKQIAGEFTTDQKSGTKLQALSIRKVKKSMGEKAFIEYKKSCKGKMRKLWHGTLPTVMDQIIYQTTETGFKVGASGSLGAGIYFAPDPATSVGYAKGGNHMFQCDVWLDDATAKDGGWQFCVYHKNAAIPRYILKFQ